MKKFSQINEAKESLEIQDNSINFISAKDLESYVKIVNKFIMPETAEICKWLIEHNAEYVKLLGKGGDNALADFYNAGVPKDASLKPLYKNIGIVAKAKRLMEIPVFQTEAQFKDIINKKAALDEIVLDLESEAGRAAIVKRYTPLCHKIVQQWIGKTSWTKDELMSYAYEGLTYAMNNYGKKSNKQKKREEEGAEELDMTTYKTSTFLTYASYTIYQHIAGQAGSDSRLVRMNAAAQKKEREEKGYNPKYNSVSGDKPIGTNKDGGEGKTLFDIVGGLENPGKQIDQDEIDEHWKNFWKKIEETFSEKTVMIFRNKFLDKDDPKKLSGKELAEKYGYKSEASISMEIAKVIKYIRKDKKLFAMLTDIYELMAEAKHDEDMYDNDDEPIYVTSTLRDEMQNRLNMIDGE